MENPPKSPVSSENSVDRTNPKEGDVFVHPNGDREVYSKGTWVVHVSSNPYTGQ